MRIGICTFQSASQRDEAFVRGASFGLVLKRGIQTEAIATRKTHESFVDILNEDFFSLWVVDRMLFTNAFHYVSHMVVE